MFHSIAVFLLLTSFAVAEQTSSYICGHWTGEFFFVYDVSASFGDNMITFRELAPDLFAQLSSEFPGAKFGTATFSDKSHVLSSKEDYCYKSEVPLCTNSDLAAQQIRDVVIMHGGDSRESQMDAMFHGAMSSNTGWSTGDYDADGNAILRVLVLVTDDDFHKAGDAAAVDSSFQPHSGHAEPDCEKYDYPSEDQVKDALLSKNIQPLFLISEYEQIYIDLLERWGIQGNVQSINVESSDIVEALLHGLYAITCNETHPEDLPGGGGSGGESEPGESQPPPNEEPSNTAAVAGAVAGVAAVAAAGGAGVYAYSASSPPQQTLSMDFEDEGDFLEEDRDVAADVTTSAFLD